MVNGAEEIVVEAEPGRRRRGKTGDRAAGDTLRAKYREKPRESQWPGVHILSKSEESGTLWLPGRGFA
jgi:hypothetical protein